MKKACAYDWLLRTPGDDTYKREVPVERLFPPTDLVDFFLYISTRQISLSYPSRIRETYALPEASLLPEYTAFT
jgi:hypothetical protein